MAKIRTAKTPIKKKLAKAKPAKKAPARKPASKTASPRKPVAKPPAGKRPARKTPATKLKETSAFKKGMAVRRAVLGRKYVQAALERAGSDPLSLDLQRYVTEVAWGSIWTRPGLDRRSRSLLNLGMLAALDRPVELKLHIRGALNNGLTRNEIKEAFLQAGVYCGAPAALDCFRVAAEVFAEIDAEG